MGNSTVIKQQWVLLQKLNRKGHPYDVTINDLIKAIKEKQQNKHDQYSPSMATKHFHHRQEKLQKYAKRASYLTRYTKSMAKQ